ncbi:MAG: hypothetical protein ACM3L6_04695 [Deltaproteobacteria bacterium]
MRGTPIVVSPKKDAVDHSLVLGRYAELLRLRNEPPAGVEDGLGMVLQTAYYYYWEGEKLDLFLRLFAADPRRPVQLSLFGSFFIEVTDLKNDKVDVGQYQVDPALRKELIEGGSAVVGLGPATDDDHELLAVFYLEDFAFVPLPEGVYRISVEYLDDPRTPGVWRGRIKSNAVVVEVMGESKKEDVRRTRQHVPHR